MTGPGEAVHVECQYVAGRCYDLPLPPPSTTTTQTTQEAETRVRVETLAGLRPPGRYATEVSGGMSCQRIREQMLMMGWGGGQVDEFVQSRRAMIEQVQMAWPGSTPTPPTPRVTPTPTTTTTTTTTTAATTLVAAPTLFSTLGLALAPTLDVGVGVGGVL